MSLHLFSDQCVPSEIKLHNHSELIPSLMQRLLDFCASNPEREFYRGKLLIVEPHRIRIRM
jgi:hypothetical protein